jgi:hypothetical protein
MDRVIEVEVATGPKKDKWGCIPRLGTTYSTS